jgi:hypothetical protein
MRGAEKLSAGYLRLSASIFLFLFAIYLTTTRGHFWTTDEVAVFQQTRSLWEHADIDTAPLPNTYPGRGGRYYAVYGPGQSALAMPLYGIGKAARLGLERLGAKDAIRALAGPVIGDPPDHLWGGQVEIFFVNLFNAIVVALVCAVFFLASVRLGAGPGWAAAAALILGLATHLAGFSAGFFQHAAEALFVLWAFYLLVCDSDSPRAQTRAVAGAAAAMMLLIRINTAALLPALTAYLAFQSWKRRRDAVAAARECAAFLLPVGIGLLTAAAVNHWKFGVFGLRGVYAQTLPFDTPLLVGLYGNLFSVGQSVFLFSPILVLSVAWFRPFFRRRPAEAVAILGMAAASLLLYSKVHLWHGQWSFGPRYLVHLVPLLLLPLGSWLEQASSRTRIATIPLVLAGLLVEILHLAVNVSYVYHREGYNNQPPFSYLFVPDQSQLAAHWRALTAWDARVDTWLVEMARSFGASPTVPIAICLLWLIAWSGWRLVRDLKDAPAAKRPISPDVSS